MAAANAVPGPDPAERLEAAHTSAQAVVQRLRDGSDPAAGERMVAAVDTDEGLDAAARLWAVASPVSLPGIMKRTPMVCSVTDAPSVGPMMVGAAVAGMVGLLGRIG